MVRGSRKNVRSDDTQDCEALSSGYDDGLCSHGLMWLRSTCQQSVGEGFMMSRPFQSNYWLLVYAAGKTVTVLNCVLMDTSKLMVTQMALVKLSQSQNKAKRWECEGGA